MALINCPECGKQISDLANVCIHCGYQLKQPPKQAPAPAAAPLSDIPAAPQAAAPSPFPTSGGRLSIDADRKKKIIIIAAAAAVLIIALVLILVLTGNKDKDKGTASESTSAAAVTAQPAQNKEPEPAPDPAPAPAQAPDSITRGLKADTTLDEAVSLLKSHGLAIEGEPYSDDTNFNFSCTGDRLFDVTSSRISVAATRSDKYGPLLSLRRVYYNDDDFSSNNTLGFEEAYNAVRSGMEKQFGQPREIDNGYFSGSFWETNGALYGMPFQKDSTDYFALLSVFGVSTYEELMDTYN